MARSTNVYLIRHRKHNEVLATCTVKYEAHLMVTRDQLGWPAEALDLVRHRDGKPDQGEIIPWDFPNNG